MIAESNTDLTVEIMLFIYQIGLKCAWYPLFEKHKNMAKVRTSHWANC